MKMFQHIYSLLILILLTYAPVSVAENTGPAQLKVFLKKATQLQAAFTQSLFDENGIELQFSAGQFSLSKPGRFSWDYDEPYHQVIMSNGKKSGCMTVSWIRLR